MSQVKALQLHLDDNVAVCTQGVSVGDEIEIMRPDGARDTVMAVTDNTYCNKVALRDIEVGEPVLKYGEQIGLATEKIVKGALANHLNIASQPRAYVDEYLLKDGE